MKNKKSNRVKRVSAGQTSDSGLSQAEMEKLGGLIMSALVDQFIADGDIDPKGKTKTRIAQEAEKIAWKHLNADTEFWPLPRYDADLLKAAKRFKSGRKYREACLFYATWFEHRVNFVVTRDRFGLSEDEKQQMVRDVSLMGKFTWLLPALGFKRVSPSNLSIIRQVVETRNAFVHFKFKPADPNLEDEQNSRLRLLLMKAEKTRRYLEEYESKHVYSGLRGFYARTLSSAKSRMKED